MTRNRALIPISMAVTRCLEFAVLGAAAAVAARSDVPRRRLANAICVAMAVLKAAMTTPGRNDTSVLSIAGQTVFQNWRCGNFE